MGDGMHWDKRIKQGERGVKNANCKISSWVTEGNVFPGRIKDRSFTSNLIWTSVCISKVDAQTDFIITIEITFKTEQ